MDSNPPSNWRKQTLAVQLDAFVSKLLKDKHSSLTKKIFGLIQMRLYQAHLSSHIEASVIFAEAYLGIYEKIMREEITDVSNMKGLFNSFCFNIIRDKKKKLISIHTLNQRSIGIYNLNNTDEYRALIDEESLSRVFAVFSDLTNLEREMMILKVLDGHSWRDISSILQQRSDYSNISLSKENLRQKYHRVRKKLLSDKPSRDLLDSLMDSCGG